MKHQMKINRARNIAPKLPSAAIAIWDSIPDTLVEKLTSSELADVVNALDRHWHKAAAHTEAQIVGDGYVWSNQHQALLEVVR